ncbi:dipicolinate synthase subunit B [Caproiciproducens sp. LBM24188]|nr:dipicolinate synthase subunit B [Oscillospiraceae bacterium]HHV31192.1 dipicolinate synthase subunit B [Clostridiales bacterium]
MENITFGFAMCGSFCTFSKVIPEMKKIVEAGYRVLPIMSQTAYSTNTRFGQAEEIVRKVEDICGRPVIHTIVEAEPIGPKKMVDLMIVAPCTGNTLAKLANGITDTSVTMAVKSTLRIGRPVLLAPATNDALSASAQNIGRLLNVKNIYFTPMRQDDPERKPYSINADFEQILPTALSALEGKQRQPIYFL